MFVHAFGLLFSPAPTAQVVAPQGGVASPKNRSRERYGSTNAIAVICAPVSVFKLLETRAHLPRDNKRNVAFKWVVLNMKRGRSHPTQMQELKRTETSEHASNAPADNLVLIWPNRRFALIYAKSIRTAKQRIRLCARDESLTSVYVVDVSRGRLKTTKMLHKLITTNVEQNSAISA